MNIDTWNAVRSGYLRWSRHRAIRNGIKTRRQPKGKRAKSGQWAKRTPCPVRVGVAVGLEHGKIRMAEQRRLFPDYFKGEPPQATYNPNGDQGAW